jgi:hypothetical protein
MDFTTRNKIKKNQAEDLDKPQGRDLFQTPNYAVDLIVPFLNALQAKKLFSVWECAAGNGKIVDRLTSYGFNVNASELNPKSKYTVANFLTDDAPVNFPYPNHGNTVIVTNPPFSLKKKFYLRCLEYKIPFALLIPADYSGWMIDALKNGAEKIVPSRRIDFITPSGKSGATGNTANFHSIWLTWGFGLGKTETFVELTDEMKKDI